MSILVVGSVAYDTVQTPFGRAERVLTLVSGLNMPNGVAFRDGALYVAEIGRILRYDHITARLNDPPRPVVVSDAFPRDTHHG